MKNISFTFLIFLLTLGCMNNEMSQEEIIGAWEISSAERNGKPTETLNGAYFEFAEDNTMSTNLLGREESSSYEFDGANKEIIQQGEASLRFKVLDCQQNNLSIETSIREIPFKLQLSRIVD